ncbi:MAG: hypothetical protein ACOC1K_06170 [Nanoarchaeota archaeon]
MAETTQTTIENYDDLIKDLQEYKDTKTEVIEVNEYEFVLNKEFDLGDLVSSGLMLSILTILIGQIIYSKMRDIF